MSRKQQHCPTCGAEWANWQPWSLMSSAVQAGDTPQSEHKPPTAPSGGEVGPEVVDRLSEALTWIAEFAANKRNGTDDWFDLVEIEQAARKALLPEPVDADLIEARRIEYEICEEQGIDPEPALRGAWDDKPGVRGVLRAIKRGRALAQGER